MSYQVILGALNRIGWTHKKKSFFYRQACKLSRTVFEWCLPQWKEQYAENHILYIDELGINTNETAEYSWSKKG